MTIHRTFGFGSYQTAWAWLHKLRRAMVRRDRPGLKGIVEVDESVFGGHRSGRPGRGALGKALVAIAIEDHGKGSGRVRMERIPDTRKVTLRGFVKRNVVRGSTVRTDGWQAYRGLDKLGYDHQPVFQRGNPAAPHQLLPHVHRVSALIKRWLLGTHQGSWSPQQLDYYLDEFTFRFNRRFSKSRGMLFYRLIEQAVVTDPQPDEKIKG